MIYIKLPKFNIDDIEIFIAKVIFIGIYLRLNFNIEQTFQNIRILKFSVCQFIIPFCVCHKEHSIDDTYRIKLLKLRRTLKESQSWMLIHYNFQ